MDPITSTIDGMISYTRNDWQNTYHSNIIKLLNVFNIKSYADIGANLGEVCYILMESIPSLKEAYLFEPQSDNFDYLQERFNYHSNIKCLNYGIYYGKTELPLYRREKNIGGYSVINAVKTCQLVGETIDLKTLEEADIPVVDFVKIDVEGAEENILRNSTYLKKVKYLDIEFHDDLRNIAKIEKLCEECFPDHRIVMCTSDNVFIQKQMKKLSFTI